MVQFLLALENGAVSIDFHANGLVFVLLAALTLL